MILEGIRPDGLVAADWADPDDWLRGGDRLWIGDRCLDVIATPGHTSGHVVFADDAHGLLFAGDHVLPHITPQLLIVAALGVLATFWNPLRTELESEGGSQGGNVVVEVDNSLKLQPAMSVRRHCAITVLAPCYTQSRRLPVLCR